MDSRQCCNLTNLNMLAFVNEDGTYNLEDMLEAQALSTKAGYRVTCMELELPEWNMKQKRDRLLGVSISGWWDFINATKINKAQQEELLRKLRDTAIKTADEYAEKLGLSKSLLVTTIKPSGSSSQLFGESAGAHASHSPYFIRRVRISTSDPLLKVVEELGYHTEPEVGQTIDNCTTKVVEFYVKAPEGRTKYDICAIEQLEMYKTIMKNYVQHNCSITVHVKPEEWTLCEEWVYNNWDDNFVAVSFIPLDDSFYQLLPYEAISKEKYEELSKNVKPFNPDLIRKYEKKEVELEDIIDDSCSSGVCAVR